jgi:group I intron endonuclease
MEARKAPKPMIESMPFRGEVYLHWNPLSQKGYVGQTTAGVSKRWKLHLRCARSPKTPAYRNLFSKALRKYGADAFESQTLSIARSQEELDNLERVWIILLQTKAPNGYNLADGGYAAAGHEVNPEVRARLSMAATEQWKNPIFRERGLQALADARALNRTYSPETIEKRAAKIRGVKQSPESIAHRVAKLKGKKRTQAFRDACAARMRGRTLSVETRAKMSEAQFRRQERRKSSGEKSESIGPSACN